jgi:hypothetical protein
MNYQQVLEEFGEEAAEAFVEWENRIPKDIQDKLTGDPVEDYLIMKGVKNG